MKNSLKLSLASLIINACFTVYHFILGCITSSWWMLTLSTYYLLLTTVRGVVLKSDNKEKFITKFTGWMLITMTIPLIGTVILSTLKDRGLVLHMIIMITVATYSFTMITLATINLIKSRKTNSAKLIALRNISFADAFVSIFALQRSMLVSFEGMTEVEIIIMNAVLGSSVCVVVFLLGLNLLMSKKILFKTLNN